MDDDINSATCACVVGKIVKKKDDEQQQTLQWTGLDKHKQAAGKWHPKRLGMDGFWKER